MEAKLDLPPNTNTLSSIAESTGHANQHSHSPALEAASPVRTTESCQRLYLAEMHHSQNHAEFCNGAERLCHLLSQTATAHSSYFQNQNKSTLIASFLTTRAVACSQKQGKCFPLTPGRVLPYPPHRLIRSSSPSVLPRVQAGLSTGLEQDRDAAYHIMYKPTCKIHS